MRILTIALACLCLYAVPLLAETYSWTDDSGTINFTEDYSSIPKKYRKKVHKRDDISGQPSQAAPAADAAGGKSNKPKEPRKTDGEAGTDAGNGLYGGKKGEQWQPEFQVRGAEVKRLEQQLIQLEALTKKPVGISRERAFGLPQEFRETQRQYNDALKRYNELNDAANKAGLPAEFRK